MRLIIFLTIIPLLSSCLYSVKYVAKYEIDTSEKKYDKALIQNIFEHQPKEHLLYRDIEYDVADTLVYFGKPYHHFKVYTIAIDTNHEKVILIYNGSFGSKKNPPYEQLLQSITDSIEQKFNLINIDINEESNKK
jgi:hypothetical protein